MPLDPELLAEARRRGIIPQGQGGKDPELLAEARRRGIPTEPQPSISERFMAGLGQRDIAQPQGLESGDIAEFVGREGLPVIGSMAGTAFGPGGMAGGAALGRTVQKGIASYLGERREETPIQAISDVATTGALQGLFGVGEKAVGIGYQALKPGAQKLASSMLRVGPGIPEKYGEAAIKDLSLLGRAPEQESVTRLYDEFHSLSGTKSRKEVLESSSNVFDSIARAKRDVNSAFQKIREKTLTMQDAVNASQAARFIKDTARTGNEQALVIFEKAAKLKPVFDEFIETSFPQWKQARTAAYEKKVAEQFKSILPLNKNLSPNVLRTYTAGTAAAAGAITGNYGALGIPFLISPYSAGLAIRGASGMAKMAGAIGRTGLPEAAARGGVASLQEIYNRKR